MRMKTGDEQALATKPWVDEWDVDVIVESDSGVHPPPTLEQAKFIAAAPEMARVLLALEWSASIPQFVDDGDGYRDEMEGDPRCPCCRMTVRARFVGAHADGCNLDAVLVAIGLPDQASRNAARSEIEKWEFDRVKRTGGMDR